MEVVQTCTWERCPGAIRGSESAIVGQVTHIRVFGVDAFVREHVRNQDSFLMSSNQRLAETRDGPAGVSVLELAADVDEDQWNRIAAIVAANDGLKRPVWRNRRWTTKLARAWLVRAAHGD